MTTAVTAYAATSATNPLTKTTITRRDVGAARRRLRHPLRGHLPLRHPHRPGRVGRAPLPRWCPATRSQASSPRSARKSRSSRSATASASGVSSTPAASARYCLAGEEQYCDNPGGVGTYNGVGRDGQPTQGGYSGAIVVDENYVLRIPTPSRWRPPLRCCARASPPTRRCGTGTPDPARRSPSSASAVSGTWP